MKELTFLGVKCSGKDLEKSEHYKDKANAYEMLSKFYRMNKKDQELMAVVAERLTNQ